MVPGVHGMDGSEAVRRVNDTLHGPVIDILSQYVPELKALPRDKAYERTLDNIPLLERCFKAFRSQRDKFRTVLVDEGRQPVEDDKTLMSCGRSLEDVVAMIVRTAAKRHFRRRYNPDAGERPVLMREGESKGLAHRVATLFKEKDAKPQAPKRSKADELYDAIKAHLLHEWQVPFVPTYADMSIHLARALGPKLLEIRELEQLKRIVDDPAEAAKLFDERDNAHAAEAAAPATPAPPAKDQRARLSEVLTPDGKRLRAEAFSAILLRPEVRAQIKNADQMLRITDTLRGVGGQPAKLLVAEMGLRLDQLAVVLVVAHETLGNEFFGKVFGQPGDSALVMRLTQKARTVGLDQKSALADCAAFIRESFSRFNQQQASPPTP